MFCSVLLLLAHMKIYHLIKDPTGESVFSTDKSMDVAAYKSTMAKHESDGENSLKRRKTDLELSDTNKPKVNGNCVIVFHYTIIYCNFKYIYFNFHIIICTPLSGGACEDHRIEHVNRT